MSGPSQWRRRQQRLSLTGEICPQCSARLFPPRDVCPHCGGPARIPYALGGRGTVYSFSRIMSAPEGYEAGAPYYVALVALDEGPLVTAQLTDVDPEAVSIGMPVEMVTRLMKRDGDRGLIDYSFKFRPVLERMAG
ncbi:MAG: Zn-ribbon domain-containing OB-fold protein [Chloroflexi bacterium]|nr:Zn-ribbon domain-containing OB-fold protein [Chloroflexota bacterium]